MDKKELIDAARLKANQHNLWPDLVCAICDHESGGWNTYAIRPESESGFMARYGAAYTQIVKATASKVDDRWIRYEDIFYCSYGLGQVMYPVCLELFPDWTLKLKYPTELCDPWNGLEALCRIFSKKLEVASGNVQKALLFYNGGADPTYPEKVQTHLWKYKE